jgi:hypothetical protein
MSEGRNQSGPRPPEGGRGPFSKEKSMIHKCLLVALSIVAFIGFCKKRKVKPTQLESIRNQLQLVKASPRRKRNEINFSVN